MQYQCEVKYKIDLIGAEEFIVDAECTLDAHHQANMQIGYVEVQHQNIEIIDIKVKEFDPDEVPRCESTLDMFSG